MRNLQQDRADVESAQRSAREAHAWFRWISNPANRTVIPCEANKQAALSYFNGEELTVEGLTSAFEAPAFRAMLTLQTSGEERSKLLIELKALTGEIPDTAKYQSTEEIKTKVEEIRRKREMQSKSPAELRTIIQQNTPTIEPDELPEHMDRAYLLALSAPGAFKRVCERYSVAAVTKRLNQR